MDPFAGAGVHVSKQTGEFIPGSPLNALYVNPPFTEYHFIDLDGDKAQHLRQLASDNPRVSVHEGDCNSILMDKVFPRARWDDYHRALCLLDPYNLTLKWDVLRTSGEQKSIEIFLNFMVMDLNMNVLRKNPDKVPPAQIARMDAVWGDDTWRKMLYHKPEGLLPGFDDIEEKATNAEVAQAFRQRLHKVAGFKFVPEPIPMRNTRGAVVYYLFFASPNEKGAKIVRDIFNKYRSRGIA